ncbi:MAG: hypothetical protein MR609_03430 [Bacteroidales bacterium]|nr:hypothetical protein [Bacteroidales bacterium]
MKETGASRKAEDVSSNFLQRPAYSDQIAEVTAGVVSDRGTKNKLQTTL